MTQHGTTKNHTIFELFSRDATTYGTLAIIARIFARFRIFTKVRMALWAKPVEGSSHIHIFFRLHVEERQVEG